jgi:hypothetical protein
MAQAEGRIVDQIGMLGLTACGKIGLKGKIPRCGRMPPRADEMQQAGQVRLAVGRYFPADQRIVVLPGFQKRDAEVTVVILKESVEASLFRC